MDRDWTRWSSGACSRKQHRRRAAERACGSSFRFEAEMKLWNHPKCSKLSFIYWSLLRRSKIKTRRFASRYFSFAFLIKFRDSDLSKSQHCSIFIDRKETQNERESLTWILLSSLLQLVLHRCMHGWLLGPGRGERRCGEFLLRRSKLLRFVRIWRSIGDTAGGGRHGGGDRLAIFPNISSRRIMRRRDRSHLTDSWSRCTRPSSFDFSLKICSDAVEANIIRFWKMLERQKMKSGIERNSSIQKHGFWINKATIKTRSEALREITRSYFWLRFAPLCAWRKLKARSEASRQNQKYIILREASLRAFSFIFLK